MNKHDNFIKIAERRTNEILTKIESLKNLSNKSFYEYSKTELLKIFNAIETEIKETKEFLIKCDEKHKYFKLKDGSN